MKKISVLAVLIAAGMLAVTGCGSTNEEASTGHTPPVTEEKVAEEAATEEAAIVYKDGTYTAEQADFSEKSGWKESITIEVVDGKIATVNWNGTHKDGGDDKKTASNNGTYGMVKDGKASAKWSEQAATVEAYLIKTQDPTKITYLEDNYHTDAITGATIGVSGFFTLAQEALESAK